MFRSQSRRVHYAILAAAHLLLTLPNLGGHTLWDMDEGVNAEAAREMLESGNWITPYFNYEIRTAKPALLYWLQATSYQVFGVNEFAARLPAVLCGLGSVLLTYELARRMFTASTGLLSGFVLASCIEFCMISHAATPDAPLLLFLLAAFYCYWAGSEGDRRWWFVPCAVFCGLAVLTKGPIGVALPALVVVLHLAWTGQLRKLWDTRLLQAVGAFVLVAGPWYALVAVDTHGKWLYAFLTRDNVQRFSTATEGHEGRYWYHVVLLFALYAPWSTFLIPVAIRTIREARRPVESASPEDVHKYRFLVVWFLTYLVFFSVAATKLPNYVLPVYPALAVATARWLDGWRTGDLNVRPWVMATAAAGYATLGVAAAAAILIASGAMGMPERWIDVHPMPNLAALSSVGLIPLAAAVAFGWQARQGRRGTALGAFGLGAMAFLGFTIVALPPALDPFKAPRAFASDAGLRQTGRDIRIATFHWFRESIVFYARREVTHLNDGPEVERFLAVPRPAYLIIPEHVWNDPRAFHPTCPVRVIARRYDFYAGKDILVIANAAAAD